MESLLALLSFVVLASAIVPESLAATSSTGARELRMSGTANVTVFRIQGKERRFLNYPKDHVTISEDCQRPGERLSCQAAEPLRNSGSTRPLRMLRGSNPGSPLCLKSHGTVVMGYDDKRNETTFCLFGDGSLIDLGTLAYFAIKPRSD